MGRVGYNVLMQEDSFRLAVTKGAADHYAMISDVGELVEDQGQAVIKGFDAVVDWDKNDERLIVRFLKMDKKMGGKLGSLQFDLTGIDVKSGHGRSLKQPIAKAVGIKRGDAWRPKVLDCTAGLGEDGFLLAAFGCEVTLIEQHPLVYAMLRDAINKAGQGDEGLAEIVGRMDLRPGNAITTMRELESDAYDVVYLDPMYPEKKRHVSARTKKSIWFLRQLLGHDEADSDNTVGLFEQAIAVANKRVVVKRPNHAPPLINEAHKKPEASHKGKSFRFDVYPRH
ncbi:Ribosomal RNA small subunit methyltransferase J [Poriferisphaera corsica]|uniref:Ribosomal RNA small subunit methyltransferase J n=2 Tax=Poriferisphaera corsica TaxID=2528020 RepID=A0A517YX15_9BACT|nr:Ribosomal RNA small subunit methyltransferase J [Poriferisphaera corsica]